MKKKLLILLLTVVAALCCALCFAGCGGEEEGSHTHEYGELVKEVPATCTTKGMQAHYYCAGCGQYFSEDKEEISEADLIIQIDSTAHTYDEYVNEVPATCSKTGMQAYYHCACGKYFDEDKKETSIEMLTIPIDKNAHNIIHFGAKSATCISKGWNEYARCEFCDYSTIVEIEIDPYAHSYNSNNICIYCNSAWSYTKNLQYELNPNNSSYYVKGIGLSTDENIILPYYYEGLPVIAIGDSAFKDTSIKSIKLTPLINMIGNQVFNNCPRFHAVYTDDINSFCNISYGSYPSRLEGGSYWIRGDDGILYYSNNFYLRNELVTEITADMLQGVTEIKDDAFAGFGGTSITIGDSVTSIGVHAFANCTNLKSITIPDSVTSIGGDAFEGCTSLTSVTIGDSIISIDYEAFEGCTSLTSITIPDSVTSIGNCAFEGCTSLESISVDENNKSYSSQDGILYNKDKTEIIKVPEAKTSVTIPNSVTSIGYSAFYNCTSLTSIIIPDSVTSIDYSAFKDCTNLESITIGNGVTSIGSDAFRDCSKLTSLIIPDSVTSIGSEAFSGCTSLTSITLPNSITSIGNEAFYDCALTSINMPDSVTSIGDWAFSYCTSLKGVYITDLAAWCNIEFGNYSANPLRYAHNLYLNDNLLTDITADMLQGVTEIKDDAFYNCTSLTSINIPDSVTSIGNGAFSGCTCLESITVQENNTTYSSQDGILYNKAKTQFIYIPKAIKGEVTIPDSITSIGSYAFEGCTSLTSIIIGKGVTSIGNYTFANCTSLTSITIPDNVTFIGDKAFADCSKLTSLIIPDSVTSIGDWAFFLCTRLESITIGKGVTSIGSLAFYGCKSLESVTFENTTGWKVSLNEDMSNAENITITDNTAQNAKLLSETSSNGGYCDYYWHRYDA